ncbi:MAG TPA: ring-cleaving dioxygenase [Opitutaceae bacterium]|nr:ring-cleaving dioxygenase [Opitutaceae bacterium]
MQILGLHHITAIASDPRRNLAFYTGVLGLRLVKRTVNFDDPRTYHFYYGDQVGTPGSILTFFPWTGLQRGRTGTGQASAIAFSVGPDALSFWEERLHAHGVATNARTTRFGEAVLTLADPDGLVLELVATRGRDERPPWPHPDIPLEHAIRGFHSVTLAVRDATPTAHLLTATMGHKELHVEGHRVRYTVANGGPGTLVDLLDDPSLPSARQGTGTVHHVAFRTPDGDTQRVARLELLVLGYDVSPLLDRNYFQSIYYREPNRILLEIATDQPGFAVDEPVAALGTTLKLPALYEPHRAEIEAALPKLA